MEFLKCFFSFILLGTALLVVSASDPDFSNHTSCDTLKSLATELYNTKGNVLNMTKVFFPPLHIATKFLRVVYYFQNENNRHENCNISYIWAEGGFLLIQPPTIFQFTSLFFNHIPNINYSYLLELTLPHACRHLVHVHESKECSCSNDTHDHELLDMLTHQVLLLLGHYFFLFLIPLPHQFSY